MAVVTGGLYYYGYIGKDTEKLEREKTLITREYPPKEVEVFDLSTETPLLTFTKTATTSSESIAYISPQISGKVVKINTKVGEWVEEGDVLVSLGDSLSTDIAELQLASAQKSLDLANESKAVTNESSLDTISSAKLASEMANRTFQNTIEAKQSTLSTMDLQLMSAEVALDSAWNAYENTLNNLEDAEDYLDDLEDYYDYLPADDPLLYDLETAILQTEDQIEALELAEKSAENGVLQAQIALEQLKQSIASQIDQINLGISGSFTQYRAALNQYQAALNGAHLQNIGGESGVLQAETALKSSQLSVAEQNIKAPISGYVTYLSATEDNFVAPGQVMAKIENPDSIKIKTSVNSEEATLISAGDLAEITIGNKTVNGTVLSVSPTLNDISKKIDVEVIAENNVNIASGSFAKVKFLSSPKNRTFVPLNSISIIDNEKQVKTVVNNKIICKKVQTGQIIGDYIEILEGLDGDEKIVETVSTFFEDGEKVTIIAQN